MVPTINLRGKEIRLKVSIRNKAQSFLSCSYTNSYFNECSNHVYECVLI